MLPCARAGPATPVSAMAEKAARTATLPALSIVILLRCRNVLHSGQEKTTCRHRHAVGPSSGRSVARLGHMAVGMAAARVHGTGAETRRSWLNAVVLWSMLSFLPDADV